MHQLDLKCEVLGAGDHLRKSQDVANFESWRGHGEFWMEHLTESLSQQAHGPECGAPFCL